MYTAIPVNFKRLPYIVKKTLYINYSDRTWCITYHDIQTSNRRKDTDENITVDTNLP